MYQAHFGLLQEPFSIAPDPAFLFLSDAHNEALAHLMYGFSHGGFVLITGEVGTGKTTLLRNLLDRTPPDLDVAFILNPRLTVRELLETLCDELGVMYTDEVQSVKQYIDVLNKHLLQTHQAGRSTVVIIDEAQNLSPAVLEQIRLLTNLETNEKKLLRIILLGQPELADMLDRTELRQLAQRITARYHLTPLSKADVHAYVSHRLARAGGNPNLFSKAALNSLYRLSKGTPRLINVIADRAMLGAYVEGKYQVTAKLVRNGAREVLGKKKGRNLPYWAGAALVVAIITAALWWNYRMQPVNVAATGISPTTVARAGPDKTPVDVTPAPVVTTPAEITPSKPVTRPTEVQKPEVQTVAASGLLEQRTTQLDDMSVDTNREDLPDTSSRPSTAAAALPATPAATAQDLIRPGGRTFVNQRRAYQAVFNLWGADYSLNSTQIPCDFAPKVGLQCLSRKGSWSEINALNAPVVLELWDEQASPYYAALTAYDGTTYEVLLGEQTLAVTPKDLRDAWFGAYVVLWQTPPDYNGSLREGDNHPTVRWLSERLAELMPEVDLGPPQTYFSAQLRNAVIRFQSDEGLFADGIVGPLTWIHLSDRLDLPAPKLSR